MRRRFDPPVPTTVLVGDITYPRTGRGWLYLAVVIDLATRMVVDWSMSERTTAGLAVAALEAAWARGHVAGGAIIHSDRGARCTSRLMAERAEGRGVRLSVGRTGSCHDDAVAESFFATLKNEMYSLRPWATRAEARHAVVGFIEACYNRRRPHSTIGYQVPAERMAAFMERAERASSEDGGRCRWPPRTDRLPVRYIETDQSSRARAAASPSAPIAPWSSAVTAACAVWCV